jgi:hypothetical protein
VTHFIRIIPIISTVTCLLMLSIPTLGAETRCGSKDAKEAESEASTLRDWQRTFDSYQRYRKCDDGAISEGYSSAVAALLAAHWEQTADLLKLFRKHPAFERFVLRHLDDTMTREQDAEIQKNALTACPRDGVHFCAAVRKRFAELNSQPDPNTKRTATQ